MSVIGIDPSVGHPAFAIWPSGETAILKIEGRGAARLYELQMAAIDWLKENGPDDLLAVFIERPTTSFPNPTLIQANGVLQAAAIAALPVPCLEISPGEWKKLTVGKGNAKKFEVAKWAALELGDTAEPGKAYTQDEMDALAIARAGASLLAQADPTHPTTEESR